MAVEILYNKINRKQCDKVRLVVQEVDMSGKRLPELNYENPIIQYAGLFLTINSFALAVIIVVIYITSGPLKIKPLWIVIFLAFMVISLLRSFVPVCPDCNVPLDVGFISKHLFSSDGCWFCGKRSNKADPEE